ncbi:MAG TPA: AraC family transcriptional regulator [Pyrinomonadaceae bacterium]|nr:AraC family transcriptional regulator [Pyrinomonadaceae bacterium]
MDQRVQTVIHLMNDDLKKIPPPTALAASVNLSYSRLCRLFKAETGETPAQYLKTMRMREAAELLSTTFLSVKEVMNRVGLKNKSHFTHDFTKIFGTAPVRYRAQHRTARGAVAGFDNK